MKNNMKISRKFMDKAKRYRYYSVSLKKRRARKYNIRNEEYQLLCEEHMKNVRYPMEKKMKNVRYPMENNE